MRVGQARKRDANEPMIVDALKKAGIRVTRANITGFPDLITWNPAKGILVLLEVKAPVTGRLTPAQLKHTAEGWPVKVVTTVDEALQACGISTGVQRVATRG